MDQITGIGGYSSSGRWRKVSLDRRGKQALTAMETDELQVEAMRKVHNDTEALRRFGEKLRKKMGYGSESRARFDLDEETGQISLKILDAMTGEIQLKLSPEEVADGLRSLEETDSDATPLSSFFIDFSV